MTRLQVVERKQGRPGKPRVRFLQTALRREGDTNMTHRRGGGIPHAWLLTKHEMFMLSVHGSVRAGTRGREKQAIRVRCLPPFHVFLHQRGGGGEYGIGQDINISPAPSLPPSFSHPLSSLLMWRTPPHPSFELLRTHRGQEEVEAGGPDGAREDKVS